MEKPKIDLERLAVELQELAQCTGCHRSLDDSVVLCQDGHGVCGECRSKLGQCPTCKGGFRVQKLTLLYQMLDKIPKPCPFADKGCSERMVAGDHKSFCQWRPVHCEIREKLEERSCPWKGCLIDLVNHVKTSHSYFEFEKLGYKISSTLTSCKQPVSSCIRPCIFKTKVFWLWFYRDNGSKRMTFRFYYLPTSKQSENFYLIVSFKKGNVEFTHTVKACETIKDITRAPNANERGLMIPDNVICMFLKQNEKDQYSVTYELITQ